MQILIQNHSETKPDSKRIRSLVRKLLQAENCGKRCEVSILFTDDEEIALLNKEYRQIDGPTDVLSFSQFEGEDFAPDEMETPLGDVVISVETARRQADEQGHSLEQEINVLLVHGILHLLGYDHVETDETEIMFNRQAELLNMA